MLVFLVEKTITQVIQHDYGKSKVTLLQIRAAIKAVKKERAASVSPRKSTSEKKAGRATGSTSRKPA
jgi:hypothetical protein